MESQYSRQTAARVMAAVQAIEDAGATPVLHEVAAELGLNRMTVGRVLKGEGWWTPERHAAVKAETRRRVMAGFDASGYRHNRVNSRKSLDARFWRHVRKSEGCWLWMASRDRKGYGRVAKAPENKAHRLAWYLTHGPIPTGMFVCHRCDNPSCVRPDHLFLGDNSDNQRDAAAKGRHNTQVHPECVNTARLTREQAREIRAAYRPFVVTRKMLADRYGVSEGIIKAVVNGKTWRNA